MSRIGNRPIPVPDGVKVNISSGEISIEGPKGRLHQPILRGIRVEHDAESKSLQIRRKSNLPPIRANHGTMRALIANMVHGVSQGFEKRLRISGVGYGAKMDGKTLVLTLGYSHPIRLETPDDVTVQAPSADTVVVSSPDRQKVGQWASVIRGKRPVEPYNLKGVKYEDEVVKKKAGKTFVSGA